MTDAGTVGFIGLGNMGFGMARNLLAGGFSVMVHDLVAQPVDRLVQQGAIRAASPREIGARCERVMLMVVSGDQVDAIMSGGDGLLETMRRGVVMIHSTIGLGELRRIAAAAEARGVRVIDCPVSGGVEGANEGTLTILCGGDPDLFEAQRPLVETVGGNVAHLGPLGAGMVAKQANNLILGAGRLAIAEAFAMARKAGISVEALYQTITTCSADSKQLRALEGALLRNEFPPATFHAVKDLSAALDSARAVGQAMPVTGMVREMYQLIDTKMGGLRGSNEVVRYFLDDEPR